MNYLFALLLIPTLALSQEHMFDDINKQLSDAEAREAQTYIHQGQTQNTIYEECTQDDMAGCDQSRVDEVGETWGSTMNTMIPIIGTMYSTVMGGMSAMGGGGGLKFSNSGEVPEGAGDKFSDTSPKDSPNSSHEKKEKDICVYIPMATEMVALAMEQSADNARAQAPPATAASAQVVAFDELIDIHETRKKSANFQFAGWGTTGACYVAYIAASIPMKPDWTVVAKAAAAGVLATFYKMKANKHRDYAEEMRRIRNSLPGAGDCNPHTRTHCFCQEPTSYSADAGNYTKYCVPPEHRDRAEPQTAMTCVNSNLQKDEKCVCKSNNTCFDEQLKVEANKLKLGSAFTSNLGGTGPLFGGVYDGAALSSLGNSRNAMARKMLKDPKDTPKVSLNSQQKKAALGLTKMGVPPSLAAYSASLPRSASATAKLSSGAPKLSSDSLKKNPNSVGRIKSISFAKGAKKRRTRKKSSSNPYGMFGKKKKKDAVGGVEVIGFAEQAQREAEINKDDEASIFETISRRFRVSGAKKLE